MRIVVLSDSHRAKRYLFDAVEKHMDTADLYIFLGDGEDDFDDVLALYPKLKYYRVAGNCDWYSAYPLYNEIKFDGKRIFFTHGHPFGVKHGYENLIAEAKNRGVDIVLFGHTHTQYTSFDNGLYIMNPGSIANCEYGIIDITDNGIMLIAQRL